MAEDVVVMEEKLPKDPSRRKGPPVEGTRAIVRVSGSKRLKAAPGGKHRPEPVETGLRTVGRPGALGKTIRHVRSVRDRDEAHVPDLPPSVREKIDQLYAGMQSEESRRALHDAFEAPPEAYGEAARAAARRRRG